MTGDYTAALKVPIYACFPYIIIRSDFFCEQKYPSSDC